MAGRPRPRVVDGTAAVLIRAALLVCSAGSAQPTTAANAVFLPDLIFVPVPPVVRVGRRSLALMGAAGEFQLVAFSTIAESYHDGLAPSG